MFNLCGDLQHLWFNHRAFSAPWCWWIQVCILRIPSVFPEYRGERNFCWKVLAKSLILILMHAWNGTCEKWFHCVSAVSVCVVTRCIVSSLCHTRLLLVKWQMSFFASGTSTLARPSWNADLEFPSSPPWYFGKNALSQGCWRLFWCWDPLSAK